VECAAAAKGWRVQQIISQTHFIFLEKNAEKEKGFQNGMLQDLHAPQKLNFASVSEMVDKDAGSPSRTSAESLSITVPTWDFKANLEYLTIC